MPTVLIIEDEDVMRDLLKDNLAFEGYEVLEAAHLKAGDALMARNPDVVLLDVNLPDGDGISKLQEWRGRGLKTPVIICTVKDREIDVVRALDLGADDYVHKPFRLRELLSRIRAVLRRKGEAATQTLSIGSCSIDQKSRQVVQHGKSIQLTATEWTILDFLILNRNCVVNREQIIEFVWGVKDLEDSRSVDVHLGRLRKKIDDTDPPKNLITVRGLGYKLVM